jgi:hypothetical protein
MRTETRRHIAVLAFLVWPSTLLAADLPKGEDIMEQMVEATGGRAAYERCHTRVSKGTLELAAQGIKGSIQIYQFEPNKIYVETNLPGAGKTQQGCDGETVWEKSITTGPRIKKGAERDSALGDAVFNWEANWRKVYASAECTGEETIQGKPCYRVLLKTLQGRTRTAYFDRDSHLLVRVVGKELTYLGEIPGEKTMSDYRRVDGVLIPHKSCYKAVGQEMVVTFDDIKNNAGIPSSKFELPADIKKLAEKEKAGDSNSKK